MNKIDAKSVVKMLESTSGVAQLFDDLDAAVEEAREKINGIIAEINEAKDDAREILDDAAMEAESYWDERSEKWQEGDRGQAYDEWKNRLRELADAAAETVEDVEITPPERPGWVDEVGEADFSEFEYEG